VADIEERAKRWVREHFSEEYLAHQDEGFREALIEAYLAGVGQARQDEYLHRQQGGKL